MSEITPVKLRKVIVDDGDSVYDTVGQSKFNLQNYHYYTTRPNLAPYYEPLKPTSLHKLLIRNRKIISFMSKLSEFDQDMTSLIMSNNPLPSYINQNNGPKYFSKMILQEICYQPKPMENVCLPQMPQKKKTFPVKKTEDATLKEKQKFRFSTDKDFKSEGNYSKIYSLRKQKKAYPQLIFAPGYGKDTKKGVSMEPVSRPAPCSQELWEPLTFSTLLEQKPTRDAPGENTFRYGKAKQWIVQKAAVPR
ncbi:testis-specific gene 13 protein isoform 2-T2 [Thomomys bottae]